MKIRIKLAILFVAALLTFIGFGLIASSFTGDTFAPKYKVSAKVVDVRPADCC